MYFGGLESIILTAHVMKLSNSNYYIYYSTTLTATMAAILVTRTMAATLAFQFTI
uniref:Uncharacterized protein n=1 Tax=Rhizophora mucronata TaxID=61149 RepID=A0A2P2KWB6_RHIMU